MFTRPLDELDFDDIEEFCQKYPEGESVEYKQELPNNAAIRRALSAFANTSGGTLLIGIKADKSSKFKPPIEGVPRQPGIEERIADCAYNGIHPPLTPKVIVLPVPNKPGNVVVVVQVDKSQHAIHAFEVNLKVYVRAGSTTQQAAIDIVDYVSKRQDNSQDIYDRVVTPIEERLLSRWPAVNPSISVLARPILLGSPLIKTSEIYNYMRAQDRKSRTYILFDEDNPDIGTHQVAGGVYFAGHKSNLWYQELNEYGIVYYANQLHKSRYEAFHGPEDNDENRYLGLRDLVREISILILIAKDYYTQCEYLGEIQVAAKLRNVRGEKLMFGGERHFSSIQKRESLEPEISASTECHALDLIEFEKSAGVIVELITQLAWGFNAYEDTCEGAVRDILARFPHEWESV